MGLEKIDPTNPNLTKILHARYGSRIVPVKRTAFETIQVCGQVFDLSPVEHLEALDIFAKSQLRCFVQLVNPNPEPALAAFYVAPNERSAPYYKRHRDDFGYPPLRDSLGLYIFWEKHTDKLGSSSSDFELLLRVLRGVAPEDASLGMLPYRSYLHSLYSYEWFCDMVGILFKF